MFVNSCDQPCKSVALKCCVYPRGGKSDIFVYNWGGGVLDCCILLLRCLLVCPRSSQTPQTLTVAVSLKIACHPLWLNLLMEKLKVESFAGHQRSSWSVKRRRKRSRSAATKTDSQHKLSTVEVAFQHLSTLFFVSDELYISHTGHTSLEHSAHYWPSHCRTTHTLTQASEGIFFCTIFLCWNPSNIGVIYSATPSLGPHLLPVTSTTMKCQLKAGPVLNQLHHRSLSSSNSATGFLLLFDSKMSDVMTSVFVPVCWTVLPVGKYCTDTVFLIALLPLLFKMSFRSECCGFNSGCFV